MTSTPVSPATTSVPTCYRHNDRECYVRCTRCERSICPDCMREASVGFQCPDCVKDGNRNVRQARTVFGGAAAGQGTPWVTITLVLLNLAAYVGELQRKTFQGSWAMLGDGLTGPDGTVYNTMPFVPPGFHQAGVTHGEWYRLLTGNFIHALPTGSTFGITHILFNMVALWQLGPVLEYLLGRARFAAVYLVCGFGSTVSCYLLSPHGESFGASGAVFGLVAVYFVLSRKQSIALPGGPQMLIYYLVWLVASMRVTSWQGHLGGLVTGLVLGAVIGYAPRAKQTVYQAAGLAAVVVLLTTAVVVQVSRQKADLAQQDSFSGASGRLPTAVSVRVPSPRA